MSAIKKDADIFCLCCLYKCLSTVDSVPKKHDEKQQKQILILRNKMRLLSI